MREYIQKPGVRPWHGNELVELQSEVMEAMTAQLKKYGAFIIDGIDVAGTGPYSFSSGLAFIQHPSDGWKIVRFAGAVPSALAGIIYVARTVTTKLYNDGNNHDAVYEYTAEFFDEDAPGYAAFYASLTDDQRIYITAEDGNYKQGFDTVMRRYALPAFATVGTGILSINQVHAADIEKRVCHSTGQVFLRGSVTIKNAAPPVFGNGYQWLPVKVVENIYIPSSEVFFTGTIRYDQASYAIFTNDGGTDVLMTFGFSVGTDGKLYMGVVRPIFLSDEYTVYFNTSYFYL